LNTKIAPNSMQIAQRRMRVCSIFVKLSFTSYGYLKVSLSNGRLSGLINLVETLLKMRAPKPNPPIMIPDVRPGYFGNQSHA